MTPTSTYRPLSSHSRGFSRITLHVRQHGFHLLFFHPTPASNIGLLHRVMRTTKEAREAYSRGRDLEGNQRIAELKAVVDLVSTFVIPNAKSAPTNTLSSLSEAHRVSPPSGPTASRKASLSSPTPHLQPQIEDASRKRCASAQGDRVLKSLKLEPKDEPVPSSVGSSSNSSSPIPGLPGSLSGPPSASHSAPPVPPTVVAQSPIPPPLLHSQTFPPDIHSIGVQQARPQHIPPHLDTLSLPTAFSTSSSRSESSAGTNANNAAIAHQLALMQKQPSHLHTPSHSHPHQHSHSHSHSHSSHHVPSVHSPLSLGTPKASMAANGNAPPPTGWPDTSMIAPLQGMIPITAAQTQASRFRAPGPPDPASHSSSFHSPQHTHPGSTHQPLPPPARLARSSSYSGTYPFAFNVPSSAVVAGMDDSFDPSRPSTSVSVADSSSPDLESDRENSPGRVHGVYGGSIHHPNNDVPAELKAEVDRIFFHFLSMICSDRELFLLVICTLTSCCFTTL